MKPAEASKFYDAERTNITLNHSDFSVEEDNDYLSEKKEIISYLLSKNWDDALKVKTLVQEIKTVNFIFEDMHKNFRNKIDSVEILSLMTDFYNIDYTATFEKLIMSNRQLLIMDLEKSSGKKIIMQKTLKLTNIENDSFTSTLLDT